MPPDRYSVRLEKRKPTATRPGLYKLLKWFDTEKEARAYIEFNGNRTRTYAVFQNTWVRSTQKGGPKRRDLG